MKLLHWIGKIPWLMVWLCVIVVAVPMCILVLLVGPPVSKDDWLFPGK